MYVYNADMNVLSFIYRVSDMGWRCLIFEWWKSIEISKLQLSFEHNRYSLISSTLFEAHPCAIVEWKRHGHSLYSWIHSIAHLSKSACRKILSSLVQFMTGWNLFDLILIKDNIKIYVNIYHTALQAAKMVV